MLFQASTKHVVTVIARNRINGVSSLFYRDRILRFGKNMPQSLKGFLSNFNTVAIQNSYGGFCNTLNVRNNSKTSHCFPFIRGATSCNWFFLTSLYFPEVISQMMDKKRSYETERGCTSFTCICRYWKRKITRSGQTKRICFAYLVISHT